MQSSIAFRLKFVAWICRCAQALSKVLSSILHAHCRNSSLLVSLSFKHHMPNLRSGDKFVELVSGNRDQQPRSYLQCVLNS